MASVAILGFGVVGSGVAELLCGSADHIADKLFEPVSLKYVLDIRDFPSEPYPFIKDFSTIVDDPEVRVVVETIGGKGAAYDFTKRCLSAGKSVVTSNKELVAEHGAELLALARANNLNYLFEASVGGGIPIIRPISQCLSANRISEISGILNGTTNFILTQMSARETDFSQELRAAQSLGYAETDPSDDISGKDTCRKICILASLAFGRHIYPRFVHTQGIESVTLSHIRAAEAAGYRIKLIGRARQTADGRVFIITAPYLVPFSHPLSAISDVYNGIVVVGDAIGETMFYGQGAGKMPTASAVVADVMDCVKHLHARKYLDWDDAQEDITAPESSFETSVYSFEDGLQMRILS